MDYRPIIESSYNRSSWQTLLHDIFRQRVEFVANPIPVTATTTIARQAYYLGKVTLSDGETLNIYEVQLTEQVELMRNRVGIRNLLLNDWRAQGCAGAFLFCYRPGESMLRFSYVSEAWRFGENAQYEEQKTDTRRFTYLLGEGRRCRTAIAEFEKLAQSKQALEDVTKVFNIEAVSDAFFRGYKERYEDIIEYITGKRMVKRGNKWEETVTGLPCQAILDEFARFDDPEKSVRDYVKKLMGRLVFLQFLQKKGWMGVPAGLAWTGGDPEFLQNLFARSNRKDTFIDDVLEPLFNDLNTKRTGDLITSPEVNFGRAIKVPYLNGGLFEMDEADQTTFSLPARFIENLLTFFSYYNFTIDENDPDDAEIGVDPEMLGRIFENLLEDNKDKGAFYTPKEIVQYMCRESLIAYLTTYSIEHGNKNPREAVEKALRDMVNTPDVIVPRMKPEQKENFGNALRDVKICDPAIGSGAFPMGLLNELVRCRVSISAWAKDKDGRLLVDDYAALKREIISNNIYGVDIERGAIDIARLRFWLSIIVDEKVPHTLPNLDYKFMQGNSLITTFDGEYVNLDTKEQKHVNVNKMIAEKRTLHGLKQQYYKATGEEKYKLAIQIKDTILRLVSRQIGFEMRSWVQKNATENTLGFDDAVSASFQAIKQALPADKLRIINLAESLHKRLNDPTISLAERALTDIHFFDWRIMFTEVFEGEKPGFDIVIGNPPYINVELMPATDKEIYKKTFKCFYKRSDIFALFLENALMNLSSAKAVMTFIIPSVVHSNLSYQPLRNIILKNEWLKEACYTGGNVFNAPTVDTTILICHKQKNETILLKNAVDFNKHIAHRVPSNYFSMFNNVISIGDKETDSIFGKLFAQQHPSMDSLFTIYQGIVTGNNPAFIFETKKEAVEKGIEEELLHPMCHGRDIERYAVRSRERQMIYLNNSFEIEDFPNTCNWLSAFKDSLSERREAKKGTIKWFCLQWPRIQSELDQKEKILVQNTRNEALKIRIAATLDDQAVYGTQGLNFIIPKTEEFSLRYVLGILNSTLINYLFSTKFLNLAIKADFLKQIHIPKPSKTVQRSIEDLVDRIISSKKDNIASDTSSEEQEIDQLVYNLYNLTPEEIAIIEV